MKKTLITVFTAVMLSAFMLFSGACGGTQESQLDGDSYTTEGWLDDDTFQVVALGAPAPDAKGLVKRKTQAKEAALLSAQKRVVELFVGARIAGASGSDSGESTGIAITKEFEGLVKGGEIAKITYDEEHNCEIVYRVRAENLKDRVESGASAAN
ncbi:MAG: hypothetical protein OEZ13_05015 [Spirochaetia bacterium]|nr:hypothetical protein [Spirochaetia bacterium]